MTQLQEPPKDRFCDLVMKGGITSGVVYPKAIELLSHHYPSTASVEPPQGRLRRSSRLLRNINGDTLAPGPALTFSRSFRQS